jgi:hypothetical protein
MENVREKPEFMECIMEILDRSDAQLVKPVCWEGDY